MPTSFPTAEITFPLLGDWFKINTPPSFVLFGLTIHWYGVIMAVGFLLAVWYAAKNCKHFGLDFDTIIDLLLWAVPFAIIGGRIYFVVFKFEDYKDNLWDIFKIWEGGIAFYGVFIAAIITTIIFCRKRKIKIGAVLDFIVPGFLIAQAIGRWGNFINREAFGVETDIFSRMGLTVPGSETIFVHPAFLYESVWNTLGLIFITIFLKMGKRKYDGQVFAIYLIWYGFARFVIESIRTDSLYLFSTGIRASQLVGGLCILGSIIYLAINGSKPHSSSELFVNIVNESKRSDTDIEASDTVSENGTVK